MLDQHTIDLVKATAPALADKGLNVTLRMYDLMFTNNPEVKPLFNMANQSPNGQPLALARSVHAYAANIDNLEALAPAVELIANKHASLGVRPEHYGIVGSNLLQALKEVMDLSEEQMQAWATAYNFLADVFIDAEAKLYEQVEKQEGGWQDYRTFQVDRVVQESETVTSFYLKPKDRGQLASFKPGQYVTVRFDFPGANVVTRNYSLSDAPNGEYYRISIKRERRPPARAQWHDGLVSCYLHDYYRPGMEVQLRAPMGHFFLDPDTSRPVVLLSGGVGITPMISMVNAVARDYPRLAAYFIHGALNRHTHAMREHVRSLAESHRNIHVHICYSEPDAEDLKQGFCDKTGFITADWLGRILPTRDCDYYFCGPNAFMQTAYEILKEWNVPPAQIHYEFFGPAGEL